MLRILGITIMLLTTACAVKESYHGASILNEENLASIMIGSDSKQTVAAKLGSPTAVAPLDPNRWIYLAQYMATSSFSRPTPEDQRVIQVVFDDQGRVAEVINKNKDDYVALAPDGDETETFGRDTNILQEVFGNIGRFNPGG